jgi:lysophospholipase L1-like esterase
VKTAKSDGWTLTGRTQAELNGFPGLGLAGLSLSTDRREEWLDFTAECTSIDIYLLAQPSGGKVEILLDGKPYEASINLESSQLEPRYSFIHAGDYRSHTIEIRTVAMGRAEIFGLVAERDSPGVTYDALGINGARASRPLMWNRRVLRSNLQRRDPDLIVVAYGTNEVGDRDLDLDGYGYRFRLLLDRFREAVPHASLLVVGPPDRAIRVGPRWKTIDRMRALVSVQRRAALQAGAAFADLFEAMGGEGAIERWARQRLPLAQPDRVHLTAAGYRLLADALYAGLMNRYFESLALSDPWIPEGAGIQQ